MLNEEERLNKIDNEAEVISLFDGRNGEEPKWELPRYGHPLARGVFPLRAKPTETSSIVGERLGTAFCVGRFGILATAMHCFIESLGYSGNARLQMRRIDDWPKSSALKDVELFVTWHQVYDDKNGATVKTIPLTHLAASPPSDLLLGSAPLIEDLPLLSLRMSFRPPRIGSKVVCVGYSAAEPVDGRHEFFNYTFSAIEAEVVAIFPNGLGSVLPAACFLIDKEPPHGMSGGPVFDEHGNVCGIVSKGATMYMPEGPSYPKEAGVVSLLHPILPTSLEVNASKGPITASIKQPVAVWVAEGHILTDGSLVKCSIQKKDDGYRVGCAYDQSHFSGMFGGLQDFLEGKLFDPSSDDSVMRK